MKQFKHKFESRINFVRSSTLNFSQRYGKRGPLQAGQITSLICCLFAFSLFGFTFVLSSGNVINASNFVMSGVPCERFHSLAVSSFRRFSMLAYIQRFQNSLFSTALRRDGRSN